MQHNDGFTIHFPGWGFASELAIVQTMRNFSAAMMALPAPAAYPAPSTPLVSSAVGGRVAWRGAALAATYDVQTAAAAGGPWTTVSPSPGPTDNDAPWAVPGGLAAGAWVRLRGVGLDGAAGPWSAPAQAQAQADAPTASATRIEASCASSSVRVRIAPAGAPADVEPTVQARRDACGGGPSDPGALTFGNIRAAFDAASGLLSVSRVSDGAVLLAEVAGSRAQAPRGEVDTRGNALFTSTIAFAFPAGGAAVYGLGEHKTGRVDYAAAGGFSWRFEDSLNKATLADNGDISLPVLHASSGVTVMLNTPSFGSVAVTPAGIALSVNSSVALDLWFSVADAGVPTWVSLMGHLSQVIGPPAPLPTWATGFWQSKLRYRNQTELLAAARGYVDRGLPISAIAIDYGSWTAWGAWDLDPRCWPDPLAMAEELQGYGVALVQSVWPIIQEASPRFAAMRDGGLLVLGADGEPVAWNNSHWSYLTYVYDPFNTEARAYLSEALWAGYGEAGTTAYWLDGDEPQGFLPGKEYYAAGRDVEVGMAYSREHQRGVFEGQLKRGATAPLTLSRSTWLGGAQFGGAVWSGDVKSNWSSLAQQVAIAQNMALSGVWLWNSDVGGFSGGNTSDPAFPELLVRWAQFGAFCPLFRIHGIRTPLMPATPCGSDAGAGTEVWEYGERAAPILAALLSLREQLREYIAGKHAVAEATGVPVLTPTFFHFPADAQSWSAATESQFVFGGDWIVAPVLEYQAASRSVWLPTLPADEAWVSFYDCLNSSRIAGGQRITVNTTDIARFPLFFRSSLGAALERYGLRRPPPRG